MARDYKTKRSKPGGFSGWLGVACGLGLGLGVAAVVYLKDHRLDAPVASAGKTVKKRPHGNEAPEAGDPVRDDSKTYAFYEMLPKFEVVVPEKDKDVRPDIKAACPKRAAARMYCKPAHTRISRTPIACAPSWRCRASNPTCRR